MTTLSGRVTVHGSRPATNAVVELHNASGDIVDQVRVDDDGRYIYHVVPGTWALRVWDAYGHRGEAEISVEREEEKILDIALDEPEGGH